MCLRSLANGESPALVRRSTASSRSAYGITSSAAGRSSGMISGYRLIWLCRFVGVSCGMLEIGA